MKPPVVIEALNKIFISFYADHEQNCSDSTGERMVGSLLMQVYLVSIS
jgi:citrate synthase